MRNYELVPVPEDAALRAELGSKSLSELHTILFSLKETVHNKTDLEQPKRLIRAIEIARYTKEHPEEVAAYHAQKPLIVPKVYGIFFNRAVLHERIYRRLHDRIKAGMIEETENLHNQGYSWQRLESLGLEYRFTAQYLQGLIPEREVYIQKLYHAICQFAKRQETWIRRMIKNGISIHPLYPPV